MVIVDSVGTIFMASNFVTTSLTKHMDIRYMYVNEYVEDGIVKFFVKSAENDSNIITTNLSREWHEKHSKKMIDEKPK